jgi:hypothetical protein
LKSKEKRAKMGGGVVADGGVILTGEEGVKVGREAEEEEGAATEDRRPCRSASDEASASGSTPKVRVL